MLSELKQFTKTNQVSSRTHPVRSDSNLIGFSIGANMKQIPLTQGKYAIVDAEDYGELLKHKWCALLSHGIWYAARCFPMIKGKKLSMILMHRQIMNAQKGQKIDHRDGDGLHNQKCNLRFCNHQQNMYNQKKPSNCSSEYKGVFWHKGYIYKDKQYEGKWHAQITLNYKTIYLGYFDSEIEAAKIYDLKAKELFGEFARTNF